MSVVQPSLSRLLTDCRGEEHLNDVPWMCDIIHYRQVVTAEFISQSISGQFTHGPVTPDNGLRNDLGSTQHLSSIIATH